MNPIKVYPNNNTGDKKELLKIFTAEQSILGTDKDNQGKFYIIVDGDCSDLLKSKKLKEICESICKGLKK